MGGARIPGALERTCGSPWGNTTTSPSSRRTGSSPMIPPKHAPLVIAWYSSTCATPGRIRSAIARAAGASATHGEEPWTRKYVAPVSRTERSTSERGSAPTVLLRARTGGQGRRRSGHGPPPAPASSLRRARRTAPPRRKEITMLTSTEHVTGEAPRTGATIPSPDLASLKKKQQATWSSGDYAVIGTTLQIVGEAICEAVDLRPGERVLDVAAGNGNAALAAARRFADVTATDYVPALLARARARAAADGVEAEFREADAENLPFADASFDVVLSTFGVMFAPDQERAASQLARVARPGGRIGLASWTPEGFVGEMFRLVGSYAPPPAGVRSPALWGKEERVRELLGPHASDVRCARRTFAFRYRSARHFVDVFRTYYGPVRQ